MTRFPGDSDPLRTDRKACAIVHYQLNSDDWEFRLLTGQDVGCDCEIELAKDNKWTGKIIKFQIKGTTVFEKRLLKSGAAISFPLEIKTINYALNCPNPFLLVVVDVKKENAYYIELHDYISDNEKLRKKLESEQQELSLHIPLDNLFANDNQSLKQLAWQAYVNGTRVTA